MTTLNEASDKLKPNMEDCRVFYINVDGRSYSHIPEHMEKVISDFSKTFNTTNVIFVPSRNKETGWQKI